MKSTDRLVCKFSHTGKPHDPTWIAASVSLFLVDVYDANGVVSVFAVRLDPLRLDGLIGEQVHPGGGIIRATVLVDGVVRGTWTFDRGRSPTTIRVDLFDPVGPKTESGIAREVEEVGRFIDQDVTMEIAE